MNLSISYWLHGQFVHDSEVNFSFPDPLTPRYARLALGEDAGGVIEGIVWHEYYGYRLYHDRFRPVYRRDLKADPRHFHKFGPTIWWEDYDRNPTEVDQHIDRIRMADLDELGIIKGKRVSE